MIWKHFFLEYVALRCSYIQSRCSHCNLPCTEKTCPLFFNTVQENCLPLHSAWRVTHAWWPLTWFMQHLTYLPAASTRSFANSRPSSGNGEDPFLSSAHYLRSAAQVPSGSRMSDTSSASTDDSGISVNFEHGGGPVSLSGPLEPCSSATEYVSTYHTITATQPDPAPYAGHQNYPSRQVESLSTQQTVPLPVFPSDSLQQRFPDLKPTVVAGPRFSIIDTPIPASSTTWSPANGHTLGTVAPGIPTSSKQQLGQGARESPWTPKTASKPNLLYGMFSKTEDGTRWQCEECKRMFSSQGSLRAHARIHTGERPYQCQYCFRTFCQASTLRSHERLHTGEKPYKCEHCGRAFTQSAGLRSHLKTHRYDS